MALSVSTATSLSRAQPWDTLTCKPGQNPKYTETHASIPTEYKATLSQQQQTAVSSVFSFIHFLFPLLLLLVVFYWDRSHSPGWPETHCVADNDFELVILLHPSPKCWDSSYVPQHTGVCAIDGILTPVILIDRTMLHEFMSTHAGSILAKWLSLYVSS